jgi:outer membrane protein TolC
MKNKFIIPMALLMTVTFSLPTYVYADNSGSSSVVNSSLSLSAKDAVNLVEKGYNQIVLDDRYIEILDKQYEDALANQRVLEENSGSSASSMVETDFETLKLNAPVALYNLNNEKHQREIDLKNAKVTITNEYENILAAQMQTDYINEEISNLQKDMDSINEKIKVGLDKASDIDEDKATMAKYQASLSSAQNGIQSSMISLKSDLGIDINTQLTLTSKPMDYAKFDDTNIEGKIQTAIQNSYSIMALQPEIENTQIEYDIYKEYSDPLENTIQINIEDLQNQLNEKPNSIEVQLRTQYNTLKSIEDTVEADKVSIEASQINLDTIQVNYNIGQVGYLDVLSAQLQLSNAKNTLQQDIISYMTASMNFQNSLEEQ